MLDMFVLKERFARPALVYEATCPARRAAEPPSFLAAVTLALPEEDWPQGEGEPLTPLVQLNLKELPFRPPGLQGVEFLTLFVGSSQPSENGRCLSEFCLRTYKSVAALRALEAPPCHSGLKVVPLGLPRLLEDFPEVPEGEHEIDPLVWEQFKSRCPSRREIKLGGWPTSPLTDLFARQPGGPEFVFQVACTNGDLLALGRGTSPGMKDKWVLQWQCKG